ncbi:MAG: cytochrome c biogenesis CcdA family protein, partial [Desulfobacter sp.]
RKFHFKETPFHLLGTFLIGMAFGAGWSPCIGPMLGSILIVAGSQETILKGVLLLATYSAGMALPFIVISIFINSMLSFMKKATRAMGIINKCAGGLLIIIGLLLIFDKFRLLAAF